MLSEEDLAAIKQRHELRKDPSPWFAEQNTDMGTLLAEVHRLRALFLSHDLCHECAAFLPAHAVGCVVDETPPPRDERLHELAVKAGLVRDER